MTKHVPDVRTVQRHMQQIKINRANNPYDKNLWLRTRGFVYKELRERELILRRLKCSNLLFVLKISQL